MGNKHGGCGVGELVSHSAASAAAALRLSPIDESLSMAHVTS